MSTARGGVSSTRAQASARTRRATMQDVAREAGVSVSAVSKVVRDAYGVSADMRERVNSAIERLGYRPHAGARAMRGSTFTVGMVLPDLSSPFPTEVAHGVSRELGDTPFQEIIALGGVEPETQRRAIEALVDRHVDGLVLVAPWLEVAWIEELAVRVPVVAVALHGAPGNFDTVINDDRLGVALLVDHLAALGHRRIAHTAMPDGPFREPFMLSHTARRRGYETEMRRRDLEPEVVVTSYSEEGGHEAAQELFARAEPPTAILAGADVAALGVLRAAEERGLSVPGDVSIVGYDNIMPSRIGRISLTTVDQSGSLTGAVSARLLLERIQGRKRPVHYVIAPRLESRSTVAAPQSMEA
ncbi:MULTISPECIES: LacI family DNA-binding transcriptional regulator [Streptomyces]|uniref:LacI family DNA-binding transcriptional regulator n=1 Tax=Streptomyces caniscabiei TaxID=2746961 RepID=A0ABU4MZT5_9ACTN|nr:MULTISPECIES: LacI family DNA-binding transcriptional regulator [Streptomyces]MBE4740843.1 LacI family DNA-binding transcriptional regulator [Streptomyces caniscabiei]MBE4760603.1 LacI family DNA-binding transcriptional regulator [Streptomyces caniscabiei]MBE4774601.1 LacI family DNA-binding transcriptional regulator [Streptomyces caniscabiei]MBE4788978.1 LacI family DNA-binding transcriptional regulator [Streptomyces caniscabiei]MBE4798583.1 LacI family DNA-binding transcriptional regulato